MGKTPSRRNPTFWSDGVYDWVSIADLGSFGKYVGRTKERINERAIKESGIKPAPADTVLMSFKLSLGKASITTCPTYTNEAIMAFVDKGVYPVDTSFLYHQCRAKDWTAGTNAAVMGRTLNKKTLCQATIFLPSLVKQKAIAARLDFIQEQIGIAEDQFSKLDALVKSRFVEMFGDVKYPLVMASEIMGSFRNGVSPSKNGGVHSRVLTLSAITQGKFDSSAWKDGTFKEEPPADKRVSDRDFYICRGNGNKELVGTAAFADRDYPNLVFPDTMIAGVIDDARVDRVYLSSAWAQPVVRSQIESKAHTTNGTFKINQEIVADVRIPLPPLALQQEFATFVAEVEKSRFIVRRTMENLGEYNEHNGHAICVKGDAL